MKLSETSNGIAWLSNFSEQDRALATRLLDAFVLDGWTFARAELLDLLRRVIADARQTGPVWLLSLLDDRDVRRANSIPAHEPLVAFENFQPGMTIPNLPGSEGLVGHVLRDIEDPQVIAPTASLSKLRDARVRAFVVVTDTIETGSQVQKYVRALLRNKTLRSWKSLGWIKVVIVTYAASADGARRVRGLSSVDSLHFVRHAPTLGTLPWSATDVTLALALCTTYGRGGAPLGWGAQGGLFGFQDRVPNTVPRIFRQSGDGWEPLFVGERGRQVPTDLIRQLPDVPEASVPYEQLVADLRQERLSASISKQERGSNRDILVALSLLRMSPRRADGIGLALQLNEFEAQQLLKYLHAQGWITSEHELTDSGMAELVAGKRKPRRVGSVLITNDHPPYYPMTLR